MSARLTEHGLRRIARATTEWERHNRSGPVGRAKYPVGTSTPGIKNAYAGAGGIPGQTVAHRPGYATVRIWNFDVDTGVENDSGIDVVAYNDAPSAVSANAKIKIGWVDTAYFVIWNLCV